MNSGYTSSTDGLIPIICSVCGTTISMSPNMGFTTAKCHKCHAGPAVVDESKPLEVLQTEGKTIPVYETIAESIVDVVAKVAEKVENVIKKRRTVSKKKTDAGKLNLRKGI